MKEGTKARRHEGGEGGRGGIARGVVLAVMLMLWQSARGATQEEIVRSFNQNMSTGPDLGSLIPWFFGAAGLVVVLVIFRQRQKRAAVPKALNHPGKLMKEMARLAEIEPGEMKMLKAMAKEMDVENPLTLMLCPSMRGGKE